MSEMLQEVPGENGLPFLGHSLRFKRNCNQLYNEMYERYGPVYYSKFLGTKAVTLLSPEGNEFVLLDRAGNFSSRKAWNMSLGNLFPNGLMLRDGTDHRQHRRLLSAPFKAQALATYVDAMSPHIEASIADWQAQAKFRFYSGIKQLTLELAANIFLGETLSDETEQINQAFVDVVEASMAIVRYPLPGSKYQRGLSGRRHLEEYFRRKIQQKRRSIDADMFSQICRATDEEGRHFTDQEIIDHMIFLMMAAHDTTTSSLSSVTYALAKNPIWQARLRAEHGEKSPSYESLLQMQETECVFKESLRLYPPLPTIPRTAIRECEFENYQIHAGDQVHVSPYFTQRLASIWSHPEQFDPQRFAPDRAEGKTHKHAWIPFGGGAHKCLGLKFADLQVKLVLVHLLRAYHLELPAEYQMPYQPAPIGKPTDLLPLGLLAR